jgi:superfamily II DNA or RNA helicase
MSQDNIAPSMLQTTLRLAVQASTIQPEKFQALLMNNISKALLRAPSPPCLLRAPTGSGKTFVIGQVLEQVSEQRDVLWFWFVPFVTLVGQTLDSLLQHAPTLAPALFSQGAIRTSLPAPCSSPQRRAWRGPNGAQRAMTPMRTTKCAAWLR